MKTRKPVLKPLVLVAGLWVCCALRLHAQSAPTITTQPASQTNLAGSNVMFSVTVAGTGPFSYQWQFNGTNLPNDIITTVAGGGSGGDGGVATNASLDYPYGVVLDALGNLYIADSYNNRIRKVDSNGIITTVAGNASQGFSGDGGAATNASLNSPRSVAFDGPGNMYIADTVNLRVREVGLDGNIVTVAGNGSASYSGDGGTATNAGLSQPWGVALDAAGNLYIADHVNMRIRKVDTNGIITTVAGDGKWGYSGDGGTASTATLDLPCGVALDAAGNLYIADSLNNCIREVDTNGIISTVAGNGTAGYSGDGGAATNANLSSPFGIVVDAEGNLYVADVGNQRIRKMDTNGIITTVAGNGTAAYAGDGGTATNASLDSPADVTVDAAGNLFIADSADARIREVHFAGLPALVLTNASTNSTGNYAVVITTPYGSVTSAVAKLTVVLPPSIVVQPASQGVLLGSNATLSVTVTGTPPFCYTWYLNATNLVQSGTNSSLIVTNMSATNTGQYTVVVSNAYASVTSQVAMLAFSPFLATQPNSQVALPGNNVTFNVTVVGIGPFNYEWQFNGTNLPNNIISTVAGSGLAQLNPVDGGPATNASLYGPSGVALDAAGNLYIADKQHNRIRWVNTNGIITTVAGNGTNSYTGDGGPATNAGLYYPSGVALDAAGNLYIADQIHGCIREVDTNGIITTVAGGGAGSDGGPATNANLGGPSGVALDAAGDLYIAAGYYYIRKVDTNGIITTVAGNGSQGFSGDGSAATGAKLNRPQGVALDAAGNLYIADTGNNRIREVDTNGNISTVAGNGSATYGGDGGAAISASLDQPSGVAVDGFGGLYIADSYNNRIREVTTNGIISTLAGGGTGGDGGAAANAILRSPAGVAFDATGNLYIADTSNARVRKVLLYASYPTLALSDVGVSNAGNYTVVITNAYGSVTSAVATLIVQAPPAITVQPSSQPVVEGSSPNLSVTVAGSGPFDYLWYFGSTNLIQSGTNNTLALSGFSTNDAGNYTVVVTNAWGSVTSQIATLTLVFAPSVIGETGNLAVLAGNNVTLSVAVAGTGPFSYQWQSNGINLPTNIITTVAGNGTYSFAGDGGPATNASLLYPQGVTLDASGNLYIADGSNSRVRKVDTNGLITTVAGGGSGGDGGPATNASLCVASGVALDASGNLYIADANCGYIRKVDTNGIITTVAGCGTGGSITNGKVATNAVLGAPKSVVPDESGNLYIACTQLNLICKVDTNGIITFVAGSTQGYSGDGGAATQAKLYSPSGVALDSVGNLYIADSYNQRIRKVGANGIITTVAGNGNGPFPGQGTYSGDGGLATNAGLNRPSSIALDSVGDLYIADQLNGRVRKVDTQGIITTVAGNGTEPITPFLEDYAGDGGAATNACLGEAAGVALDCAGNLYIADTYNERIREVHFAGFPTLTLTNVSTNNTGNYAVVVTSPYGSVTQLVTTLSVLVPPHIITGDGFFGLVGNQLGFNVSGMVGHTIVVDGSADLVSWTPLCTNTAGGNPFYFCDPCWTNFPWRFYRARMQ